MPLLVGMVLINWIFGLMIEKYRGQKLAKAGLIGACICSLTLLGIFKYLTLILGTTHDLFGLPSVVPQILLPIGISFYTFQLLSYVVDVYRGEVEAQTHFFRLLLYTSLFHQCIAGPIVGTGIFQRKSYIGRSTGARWPGESTGLRRAWRRKRCWPIPAGFWQISLF